MTRRSALTAAVVAAAVIALDQATKALVRAYLSPAETVWLLRPLVRLTRVGNEGASFGLMQGRQPLLIGTTLVVLGVIVYVIARMPSLRPAVAVSLGLVFGGSVGNLIDRVSTGQVTDFLDLGWWPVFNVADSAVVVGVSVLVAMLLTGAPLQVERDGDQASGGDAALEA